VKNYVHKAYASEDFDAHVDLFLPRGDFLVQENFIGTGVGVEVLADRGEILVAFQHVRVHEPLMGGGSTYRKSAPLTPDLLDASRKFLNALDYTGVAMIEFIVNFATGDWVFVEINGRFWGSLPLALAAGADFPYYLYQLQVEGRREFPQDYKKGVYCRNWAKDLKWMAQNFRADRSDPTLATRPLSSVALEPLNILTFHEHSDTFVLDDPKPGFAELCQIVGNVASLAGDRMAVTALALPFVRQRRRDAARQAIARAKTVLFVCKGNICRSPFAQGYARAVWPRSAAVLSSGYYPEPDRASPPQAVNVAREFGVDLTAHRSTVLADETVRQADVILVFDEANRRTLLEHYPRARSKIHRLGVLAEQGPFEIRDPFGGSENGFRVVYERIKRCIDACGTRGAGE
jgi:protein-tyrosine-phosphatase